MNALSMSSRIYEKLDNINQNKIKMTFADFRKLMNDLQKNPSKSMVLAFLYMIFNTFYKSQLN